MPHHRDRADSFLRTIQLVGADPDYIEAVPLLAVHSAISLADAILIVCTEQRASDVNHRETLKALQALCAAGQRNSDGLQHLSWLLRRKTDLSYGDDRLDLDGDIKAARLHAERFAAWAYTTFPEIGRP